MRTGRVVLAVAILLALAGCVPAGQHVASLPTARATPVFASDAEALAAAETAYAAYEEAVDRSLKTLDASALSITAVGTALSKAMASVASFQEQGRKQIGDSVVRSITPLDLSSLTRRAASKAPAQIYGCLDISGVDVVDSLGRSVAAPGRQTVYPTVVALVWSSSGQRLLVSDESVLDGKDFCG